MPIILLHIGQDKWHVEHKRCYGICCTVTYTKRTLGHIRRNAHTCQYRNKNERHKSPFSCGRYHKEIDQRRKKNEENQYPGVHVLIFTGEILNEKLWVDVLEAGADGIILKTGELLTKTDVQAVMAGKKLVFNYPILEKIVERFKKSVLNDAKRQEAIISYDIDEYDERFLRHLALGYTKEMIANLRGMPFGVKSLEKRQNDLVGRLFPPSERVGVNATRLVVRALELRILNIDNLEADDE